VFAAAYLLWLYQRTAFGEPNPEFSGHGHGHGHGDDHEEIHDVTMFEWIAWAPLLIAIVVFGVLPNLMFKIIDPAVATIVSGFGG
jgi:NADH-quinone oxidoreductase subunit M